MRTFSQTVRVWGLILFLVGQGCQTVSSSNSLPAPDPPTRVTSTALPDPTTIVGEITRTQTASRIITETAIPTIPSTSTPTETAPPTSTNTPTATATATPEPSYTARLRFVGDIVLDRYLGNVLNSGDVNYPFAEVIDVLQDADLTIGNLESALGDQGEPSPQKAYAFRAPANAVDSLSGAGFDLLSLANNHALDYGAEGLLGGIALLNEAGIKTVGAGEDLNAAGKPAIFEINGLRLGFLAYANVPIEFNGFDVSSWEAGPETAGLLWGTPERIAADVGRLVTEVDHVIVLLHSGREYQRSPSDIQISLSVAAIDAGATAVIGHHTHVLQPVEQRNGGIIAYGLGNFAFDIDGDPHTAVMELTLTQEGMSDIDFIPGVVRPGGSPRLATEDEAEAIYSKLSWDSSN